MGHAIGLQNGLIDEKHRLAMGDAVWLYMWLINKQPKRSNRVGAGEERVSLKWVSQTYTGLSQREYLRQMKTLRDAGYIETERRTDGFVVTIVKDKKWYGRQTGDMPDRAHHGAGSEGPAEAASDMPGTAHHDMPDRAHHKKSDMPKSVAGYARAGTSDMPDLAYAYNDKKHIETIETLPKGREHAPTDVAEKDDVPEGSPDRRNPCVTRVIAAWEESFGHPPDGPPHLNRYAAQTLISRAGKDPRRPEGTDPCDYVCNQVRYLKGAMSAIPKFPTVASLMDLRDRRNAIEQAVNRYRLDGKSIKRRKGGTYEEFVAQQADPSPR